MRGEDATKRQAWSIEVQTEGCARPGSITFESVGRRVLTARWGRVTPAAEESEPAYDIILSDTLISSTALAAISDVTAYGRGLQVSDTGRHKYTLLDRDRTYYFYVRSNCGATQSPWLMQPVRTADTIDCGQSPWEIVTVGTGTSNPSSVNPISYNANKGYSQQIYMRDDISHGAGWINSIDFNYTSATETRKEIVVYVGNTNNNYISASSTTWMSINGMSMVVEPRLQSFVARNATNDQWSRIEFDRPFYYSGGNIVVAVVQNYTRQWGTPTKAGVSYTLLTPRTNARRYYSGDGTTTNSITFDVNGMPMDENALISSGTGVDYLTNIKFNFCHVITPCP